MPGFTSHYLFGVQTYKSITDRTLCRLIQNHHYSYALGLQGPDLFFYHPASALRFGPFGPSPGPIAHEVQTGKFLTHLTASIMQFPLPEEKEIAIAYLAGFYGHYTLDRICHPFVYARTAYDETDKAYFGRHCKLETDIDAQFLMQQKALTPLEFSQANTIALSAQEIRVISKMLSYAYHYTYRKPRISARYAASAIRSFQRGLRMLVDPHGWKREGLRAAETFFLGHEHFTGMIAIPRGTFHEDPCNLAHNPWRSPWEPETLHKESFFDLVAISREEYQKLVPFLAKLCTLTPCDYTALPSLPEDIRAGYSFCTGQPT